MEPSPASADELTPRPPAPRHRPLGRRVVQVLRRLHLYAGLLMLPWVVLYGVTAFLFNHPTAFPDQAAASFTRDALRGTPMEGPPAPEELAAQVVAALQARAPEGTKYALDASAPARFTREFAFATVKADGQDVSVLLDVTGAGGTVRSRPTPAAKPAEERAPFAVGPAPGAGGRGSRAGPGGAGGRPGGERGGGRAEGLKLDGPLHDRVAASVPAVLAATGFPTGEVTVTSVPDLAFRMTADRKAWDVTYNAQSGSVAGKPADAAPADGSELSARRFLLRLHTAHGYPGEVNAKWVWAVVVDAMAFVMVFWGASGVLMWWQIKSTRRLGFALLLASAAAALWVGFAMHELLAAGGR